MSKPRSNRRPIDGVLLIDKPYDISSNGALQKARWLLNAAKAGHTGVLDPLATGLLPVCLGEATKFSSYLLDADKGYRATVMFGVVTTSGAVEGEVVSERPVAFDRDGLLAAMAAFRGEISQVLARRSHLDDQKLLTAPRRDFPADDVRPGNQPDGDLAGMVRQPLRVEHQGRLALQALTQA